MTDERVDALIRRLGEQPIGESAGPRPVAAAVRMRAQAAREQDRTRHGRAMRDLHLVPGAARVRRVGRVRPILAVAAVLLLATATGLVAVGSRNATPRPDLAAVPPSTPIHSPDPAASLVPAATPSRQSATGWLVFSSNGSLYVTRGDGSERRQLTDGSVADYFPVWSPDGERVAFFSQSCVASETCPDKGAGSNLVVIESDGTNRRVLRSGFENPLSPRWVSDGSAMVATALDGPGEPSIEQVGLDGSVGPADQLPIDPAFVSPDGREVLRLDEQQRIHVSNAGGSIDRLLVADAIGARGGIVGWSPDGLFIAYRVSTGFLTSTTWRVNRDGSAARPWSELPEHDVHLGWSPNGQWMLMLVRGDGQQTTSQYIVAAPDGSNPRPLVASVEGLNWSSDGRWLLGERSAAMSGPGLPSTILVVDPEGRIDPFEIVAPGLLGVSWRTGD